jgi:hypothetical protein
LQSIADTQNNPNASKIEWINLIGNDVFSLDEKELGKIEAVNKDFVVLKDLLMQKDTTYLTQSSKEQMVKKYG